MFTELIFPVGTRNAIQYDSTIDSVRLDEIDVGMNVFEKGKGKPTKHLY